MKKIKSHFRSLESRVAVAISILALGMATALAIQVNRVNNNTADIHRNANIFCREYINLRHQILTRAIVEKKFLVIAANITKNAAIKAYQSIEVSRAFEHLNNEIVLIPIQPCPLR